MSPDRHAGTAFVVPTLGNITCKAGSNREEFGPEVLRDATTVQVQTDVRFRFFRALTTICRCTALDELIFSGGQAPRTLLFCRATFSPNIDKNLPTLHIASDRKQPTGEFIYCTERDHHAGTSGAPVSTPDRANRS